MCVANKGVKLWQRQGITWQENRFTYRQRNQRKKSSFGLPPTAVLVPIRMIRLTVSLAMYETIDPREYESYRMRRVFQKEEPRSELDARLIAMNVSAVLVDSNGKVKIRLKNDQIIERGE